MCGFVGVVGLDHPARAMALGLASIQHRGQDAAGVATWEGGRLHLYKDLGMVDQALPADVIEALPGTAGVGHVRYPTLGGAAREDAQPFLVRRPGILLAHNGNLTNTPALLERLRSQGAHTLSESDSELVLLLLAEALGRRGWTGHTLEDVADALTEVMQHLRGSYTVSAIIEIEGEPALLAFRDPWGIRPGVYGSRDDGAWMTASESVALDVLGFTSHGEIPAGSMVVLRRGREAEVRELDVRGCRRCVFERIYFARADSMMEDGRVNTRRWQLGERLAEEWLAKGLEADVIVAVPDTSRPAAMAMSEKLGIPHREGFIKNRYSGRTFIMPDQRTRDAALRLKLNPIREVFEGKRVMLVDDSIVRGSTMRRIARMVDGLGPKEVHLAIFSPPVRHPCFYGIDIPSRQELIAADVPPDVLEARLVEAFGVDSVTYLSDAGLDEVIGPDACTACFTGDYVIPVSEEEREHILGQRSEARDEKPRSASRSCRV